MSAVLTRSIRPASYEQVAKRAQTMPFTDLSSIGIQLHNTEVATSGQPSCSSFAYLPDAYRIFGRTAAAALLLAAVSAHDDDQSSRPLIGIEQINELALRSKVSAATTHPVTDYAWTRHRYRIRQAVREYSENTHANYSANRK